LLIAASILAVGLLGVISMFPTGYSDVVFSGGESKATAYAQQMLEQLKNQPFTVNGTGTDTLESSEFARTWTITQVAGSPAAPNRLANIVVTVTWGGRGTRPLNVALETMRAE
jgi:Tfp pilus assembly protein PilV